MKIAVVGSRDFPHLSWVERHVLCNFNPMIDVLVSGGAIGVDKAAEDAAEGFCRYKPIILRPNYKEYTADMKWKAPLDRNTDIVNECDKLTAFWNCLPDSPPTKGGTRDAINKALKAKKVVLVCFADGTWEYPESPFA